MVLTIKNNKIITIVSPEKLSSEKRTKLETVLYVLKKIV
jgi:hypothetical protein